MKRRDFLKVGAPLSLAPLIINGLPLRAFASPQIIDALCPEVDERVMVLVFMNGANDGINNLVPMNQLSQYNNYRPNIALPENRLLTLDSSLSTQDQVGLHPSLKSFADLYNDDKLAVIQGVGMNNPNKSHFKATDLWMAGGDGSPANFSKGTGWMGRYFDHRYPQYSGQAFGNMLDPLGIIIGTTANTGFHSNAAHAYELSLRGQDPAGYYTQVSSFEGLPLEVAPNTEHGDMLKHIMTVENSMSAYAERISQVFNQGANRTNYENNGLSNQLKTVARLMAGGCQTKLYMCNIGGWDTHQNQVDRRDKTQGRHADLLEQLSTSIKNFQEDLRQLGQEDRVMTVVFSEFGRKVIGNASNGCDHGTLGPMYVIGKHVQSGVLGTNLDLSKQDRQGAPEADQLQHDYRQVLGTILQDWMGTSDAGITQVEFDDKMPSKLPLVKPNAVASDQCYVQPDPTGPGAIQLKVSLEGYFNRQTNLMQASLTHTPLKQPFSIAPFLYNGAEAFEAQLPSDFVEWVLVELREEADIELVAGRRACYLTQQGNIKDLSTGDKVTFQKLKSGKYYVAVFHRNHLAVVSDQPQQVDDKGEVNFTFTGNNTKGTDTMRQINNTWVMLAGDISHNGAINSSDVDAWHKHGARMGGYYAEDLDGNNVTNAADFNLARRNQGKKSYFNQ